MSAKKFKPLNESTHSKLKEHVKKMGGDLSKDPHVFNQVLGQVILGDPDSFALIIAAKIESVVGDKASKVIEEVMHDNSL